MITVRLFICGCFWILRAVDVFFEISEIPPLDFRFPCPYLSRSSWVSFLYFSAHVPSPPFYWELVPFCAFLCSFLTPLFPDPSDSFPILAPLIFSLFFPTGRARRDFPPSNTLMTALTIVSSIPRMSFWRLLVAHIDLCKKVDDSAPSFWIVWLFHFAVLLGWSHFSVEMGTYHAHLLMTPPCLDHLWFSFFPISFHRLLPCHPLSFPPLLFLFSFSVSHHPFSHPFPPSGLAQGCTLLPLTIFQ